MRAKWFFSFQTDQSGIQQNQMKDKVLLLEVQNWYVKSYRVFFSKMDFWKNPQINQPYCVQSASKEFLQILRHSALSF